ncbi:hypothetical protein [Gulbenkiania mobilis]|uniref:Riboflavin biosynthesis protein RibA n=1 Tax=Gulbenkiania mobilis TaxID=397457 RepID=A0ABY2CW51_GULMO|nr:hypothetical protein [Gulbenkiania mobilis]TCW30823.1 hypothetical protein EV669_106149 [Gulbenkiania mobilis]
MNVSMLFGERALTKLAGVCDTPDRANAVAQRLQRDGHLSQEQVQVVFPNDPKFSLKLEPEPRGMVKTAARTHLILGGLGLVVGLLAYGLMWLLHVDFVILSPVASFLAAIILGLVFGMLLGGLVAIRPDHTVVVETVRKAVDTGKCAVIAHPKSEKERADTTRILKEAGVEVVGSY